jgi:MYXO-CTERM domain-containing protein
MQVRLRARQVGSFIWPASRVAVESPDGQVREIELEERPFEVVSVFPEFPQQLRPFGLEGPPERQGGGIPALVAGAAGAGLALAGVAALALVRRRRAQTRRARHPSRAALPPSWEEALRDLDAARAGLHDDPVAAADRASAALRRYVTRRFGPDAVVRTTEELTAARPPRGARSRWPAFLELLQRLDAARFRGGAVEPAALASLLDDVGAFVADSIPPDGLR